MYYRFPLQTPDFLWLILTWSDSCVLPFPIMDVWLNMTHTCNYYIYCTAVRQALGLFFLWIQEVLSNQIEPCKRGQLTMYCWALKPAFPFISYHLLTPRARKRCWITVHAWTVIHPETELHLLLIPRPRTRPSERMLHVLQHQVSPTGRSVFTDRSEFHHPWAVPQPGGIA